MQNGFKHPYGHVCRGMMMMTMMMQEVDAGGGCRRWVQWVGSGAGCRRWMQEVDAGGGCRGWMQGGGCRGWMQDVDAGGGCRRWMQGVDAGGGCRGGVQVDPPRLVASLGDRRRENRPRGAPRRFRGDLGDPPGNLGEPPSGSAASEVRAAGGWDPPRRPEAPQGRSGGPPQI